MWNFFQKPATAAADHEVKPVKRSRPSAKELATAAADHEVKPVKRSRPSAKELATQRGEPYIQVIDFGIESSDPRVGSFELDWNHIFVEQLRGLGYPGKTDEQVVELWFQDICRNIVMETYEQEQANFPENSYSARYINRRNIGGGKSEIS